jgi:PAS domain S-box-containing protein
VTELLHALIVEDSQSDALLLLRELRRADFELEYLRVDNAAAMQEALDSRSWDIIISDFSMPNFSALAALHLVQEKKLDIPFIIVSGTMGEETAVAAMKAGAHDYFAKGRLARLGAAINRELREAKDRRHHREIEQQLYQSEKRFVQAFQSNPNAICISSLDKDILWEVNTRFLSLFGYRREEVIGKSIPELALWFDPLERQQHIERLQQKAVIYNIESQVQSKQGLIHEVLISCEEIMLGNDPCIMTFIHDITERKQAENELLALYNATSVLFMADNLPGLGQQIVQAVVDEFKQFDCGLMLVDNKRGRIIRLARTGEQEIHTDAPLYLDGKGLVPEAIRTAKVIYVPDVSLDGRYIANAPGTRSELVIPLKTSKGIIGVLDLQSDQHDAFSERDRRVISSFADRAAVAIEMVALYEEINHYASELEERVVQRTAELRHAKERVEAIFNNSSDAIVLIHSDGGIQQTNPAFDQMFAYQSDELFQKSLLSICVEEQAKFLKEAIQAVAMNKRAERIEVLAVREDKLFFNVDIALSPIADYEGEGVNIICSLRDITEQKQLEENLRQTLLKEQELSQLKTRFTAMVSHDFRTPLAVIQSSTDLMKHYNHKLSDEKRIEYLNRIQKQIKHLTNMLENILLIGKSEAIGLSFAPAPMNLEVFCQGIVDEVQTLSYLHTIVFTTSGICTNEVLDAKLLGQMLLNLLSNAIKYSPKGGEIQFVLTCSDTEIVFYIKDNGIGIPEADRERLFESFHRAENVALISGTGLGLAIVKLVVDAHKGTIQIETELERGTAFIVRFPKAI